MIVIQLIYAFAIIFAAGKLILSIKPLDISGESASIRVPMYFFAGTIVISLYMFILSLLNIPFGVLVISAPFLLYSIFLIPGIKQIKIDLKSLDLGILEWIIFAILGILCVSIFLNCVTIPVFSKDAFAMWVFKAKIFFMEKRIPFEVLTKPYYSYSSPEYPQLVPLNLVWICLCMGKWNDVLLRIFFAASYVLFIPFFYSSIEKYAGRTVPALACLLLMANPHFLEYATNGYVDVLLGMFAAISIVYFVKWTEGNKNNDLFLSSFFIGAAALTKNEGIALFVALALTVFLVLISSNRANKVMSFVGFLIPSLVIFLPYQLISASHSIGSHMINNANIFATMAVNIARFSVILNHFLFELYLNTYAWQYLWIIITLLLLTGRKRLAAKGMSYVLIFLLISLGLYFAVYMVSTADNLTSSFHRLLLGLAPSAVLLSFSLNTLEETKNR